MVATLLYCYSTL